MNKTELNQKFEILHRQVNALWDSSKSLQDQPTQYKQAWQARFEVGQEIAKLSTPAPKTSCRCRDWQLKLESQKDC